MRSLFFLLSVSLLAAAPPAKPRKANLLARESSPYLLQHAFNPVQWMPWGPEAFAKAKKEGKLVFLSIGYSSCHWCHVMERESFSDDGVAKLMNELFVCIKVDREERPDIDQVYMAALNAMGNSGGWPLSMFLDAEGRPIVGGTYWPREDSEISGEKIRGFKTILNGVARVHRDEPKALSEHAEKLAKGTAAVLAGATRGLALVDLDRKLVDSVIEGLREEHDVVHGGFGNASRKFAGPKFPMPSTLLFLQGEVERTKNTEAQTMVDRTIDRMARGGIFDHLGGGFHRYTVERTWTVPHFEKMLYDNGQLLEVYANAFRLNKRDDDARVLRETIEFVHREMTSPDGAFYSALDADSEDEEGRFYVWTAKELATALPDRDERLLFARAYGTDAGYNFEGKYHILKLPVTFDSLAKDRKVSRAELFAKLAPMKQRLFDLRSKRERPFLDTKVLTGWNGLMIAGLAKAGVALDNREVIERAKRAAEFVLTNLKTKEGRLLRSWAAAPGEKPTGRVNAYLDDHAYFVHGLLCLHEATREKRWLEEATKLTISMIDLFGDDRGGFFYTAKDHEKLFARGKDSFDGAQPSGNSVAITNLIRLWIATGDASFEKQAVRTLRSLAGQMKNSPSSLGWAANGLALYLSHKK
ncbi:MAG: thioredoxin domain-containing protein [Planctomycetia bacterium]|nr:thioredoxin domain-containing protein [Planctomycetia bacterium]